MLCNRPIFSAQTVVEHSQNLMKLKSTILFFLILTAFTTFDIAPNPISANGIYTLEECKVRMESEIVSVELFKEYSIVECTFEMLNYGKEI